MVLGVCLVGFDGLCGLVEWNEVEEESKADKISNGRGRKWQFEFIRRQKWQYYLPKKKFQHVYMYDLDNIMSHSPGFSNVCHTSQFSHMYVTQPKIL